MLGVFAVLDLLRCSFVQFGGYKYRRRDPLGLRPPLGSVKVQEKNRAGFCRVEGRFSGVCAVWGLQVLGTTSITAADLRGSFAKFRFRESSPLPQKQERAVEYPRGAKGGRADAKKGGKRPSRRRFRAVLWKGDAS